MGRSANMHIFETLQTSQCSSVCDYIAEHCLACCRGSWWAAAPSGSLGGARTPTAPPEPQQPTPSPACQPTPTVQASFQCLRVSCPQHFGHELPAFRPNGTPARCGSEYAFWHGVWSLELKVLPNRALFTISCLARATALASSPFEACRSWADLAA